MNWNVILNNAIKLEPTEVYYDFLFDSASNWVTCAVGNQCSVIPRHGNGYPLDKELYDLGISFDASIRVKNWSFAKYILKAIEIRSAILIAELSV